MLVCKTQSTAPQPPKHQNTEYVQSSKEGRGDLGSLDRETDTNTTRSYEIKLEGDAFQVQEWDNDNLRA